MIHRNHYATLHVDRCATCSEIKTAFRTLAQRFHPDVTKDRDGERKFKDVAEAYRTLKRTESKKAYDHQINNICTDRAMLSVCDPHLGYFNWGWALFNYYSWFWANRGGHDE